jgi:hypothetical protein
MRFAKLKNAFEDEIMFSWAHQAIVINKDPQVVGSNL